LNKYITFIIFFQIFVNNATDDVSIILCGSDKTQNSLDYKNIHVLRNMEKVNWEAAKLVNETVQTKNFEGDWMDALGAALDLIHRKVKAGNAYGSIQIIFFTAFESPFKTSERTQKAYISALLAENTSLFIVGSNLNQELLEHEEKMSKGELTAFQLIQEVCFLLR
jgi:hypothetical protein